METYTIRDLACKKQYTVIRDSDSLPIMVLKKPRWVTDEEFDDLLSRLVINIREK